MNLYNLHSKPESLDFYEKVTDNNPDFFWKKYKNKPEELKKREKYIVTSAKYAYQYARDVLKGPFPAAEAIIAKDAYYAYEYAQGVLKGPFPAGEEAIAKKTEYAYEYTKNILKGPFPLGEEAIASDKISTKFSYLDQTYGYEDDIGNSVSWKVKDIIDHVKDIKPELIKVELFKGFLEYVEKTYDTDDWLRVKNADLKYPIIVGAGTFTFTEDKLKGRYPLIFDGVHRLIKSKMNGVKYILAIITNTLPPPVVTGNGFQLDGISYKMTIKGKKK